VVSALAKLFSFLQEGRLRKQTKIDKRQVGFREGVGTREGIAALASVIESCEKEKKALLGAFVDFSKAFDRVPRQRMLERLREEGVEEQDIHMVHAMYASVRARVDGSQTDIEEGARVKQGEPLSPLLFLLYINDLHKWVEKGIESSDRQQGREGGSEGGEAVLLADFLLSSIGYTDDLVLLSHSRKDLQRKIDRLDRYCREQGLLVNLKKTKIMTLSSQGAGEEGEVTFDGRVVEWVNEYKYLECMFYKERNLKMSVDARLQSAAKALGSLQGLLSSLGPLPAYTKVQLFRSVWLPVATYSLEALPLRKQDIDTLTALQLRFVRWAFRLPHNSFTSPSLFSIGLSSMLCIMQSRVASFLSSLHLQKRDLPKAVLCTYRGGLCPSFRASINKLLPKETAKLLSLSEAEARSVWSLQYEDMRQREWKTERALVGNRLKREMAVQTEGEWLKGWAAENEDDNSYPRRNPSLYPPNAACTAFQKAHPSRERFAKLFLSMHPTNPFRKEGVGAVLSALALSSGRHFHHAPFAQSRGGGSMPWRGAGKIVCALSGSRQTTG